jgi:tetratricopeptide (TPR) repeat protein
MSVIERVAACALLALVIPDPCRAGKGQEVALLTNMSNVLLNGARPPNPNQYPVLPNSKLELAKGGVAKVAFYTNGNADRPSGPAWIPSFLANWLMPRTAKAASSPFGSVNCGPAPVGATAPSNAESSAQGTYSFQGPALVLISGDRISFPLGSCTKYEDVNAGSRGLRGALRSSGAAPDQISKRLKEVQSKEISGDRSGAILLYRKLQSDYPSAADWIGRRIAILSGGASKAPGRTPAKRALVVGISEYRWLQKSDYIPAAGNDASLFYNYLVTSGGFRGEDVTLLQDRFATAEAIRLYLRQAADDVAKDDVLYVYFAAHSAPVGHGDAGLIAYDSRPDVQSTLVPFSEIADMLSDVEVLGARVILFADVCRAGLLDIRNPVNGRLAAIAADAQFSGILSSDRNEASFEAANLVASDPRTHGIFTAFLVSTLTGAGEKTCATLRVGDVTGCVKDRIAGFAAADKTPLQTPVDFGDKSILLGGAILPGEAGASQPISNNPDPAKLQDATEVERKAQETLLEYLAGEEFDLKSDDFSNAAKLFDRAAASRPGDPSLIVRKKFCDARAALLTNPSKATASASIAMLDDAISQTPFLSYLYNARGIAYLTLAEYEEHAAADIESAQRDFEIAIVLDPFWAYPRHNLAMSRRLGGDEPGAELAYKQAIDWATYYGLGSGYVRQNLGALYVRQRRSEDALAEFRSVEQDAHAERLRLLGRLGRTAHDGDASGQQWTAQRILYVKQAEAEAINGTAATYALDGNYRKSIAAYRRAIDMGPGSFEIHRNLAYLIINHASSIPEFDLAWGELAANEAIASANGSAQSMARAESDIGWYFMGRARVHEKHGEAATGDYRNAVSSFSKALAFYPDPQAEQGIHRAMRGLGSN